MSAKQSGGLYSPDASKYGTIADGSGNLVITTTSPAGSPKQTSGSIAPDGSIYFTLTDGNGLLV